MSRLLLWALLAGMLGIPACGSARKGPVVVMVTSMGTLQLELFPERAPITVQNFLAYVDQGFYDNTLIHQAVPNLKIQGGRFEANRLDRAKAGTRPPIQTEAGNGLSNVRGTLAMWRTASPTSARAEFFINVKDNASFDRPNAKDQIGYCVFGKVIDGMDVVDKISQVPTQVLFPGALDQVPNEPVVILKVRRAE